MSTKAGSIQTMHNSDALHQKSGKTSFEVFSELIEARRTGVNGNGTGKGHTKVVDVCCSYGVIAALLKHEIVIDDLYTRYRSEELAGLSGEELARADAAFYGERMKEGAPEVVGVDVARNAVSYGLRSGVLDAGFAENLEEDEPTEELRRAVSGTDLLTITGGVGYISESTFERLLGCMAGEDGRLPWITVFALRWVSYDDISDVLSNFGLVTEKLAGHTFAQRRFTGAEEREYVLEELAGMDVDSTGREDTGWYHANFYLSRPVQDASIPLETLLDL